MKKVDDAQGTHFENNGFKDNGSYQSVEYDYDENGNMTEDLNKGIDAINYNHLNLPTNIVFNENTNEQKIIGYIYTTDGIKLRKFTNGSGTENTYTDYIGAYVYEESELQFIQTSEGRLVPNGNGGFNYEYAIKDHLGNTRVMFDETGQILQDQSYYPFGMSMGEALTYDMPSSLPDNKYLYNGMELQNDFGLGWYDYGARFYDPALGRFTTIDPLSEDYYSLSPYGYCAGNPIAYRDENGEWINFVVGAVVGAATDYALQVATNYVEGKTGTDAWTDVSASSIVVSAGAGAIGVGVATKVTKAMKVAKLAKGMKTAVTVGSEVVTDAAASATNQLVTTGEVNLKDVAIDATAGQIVGNTVSKAVKNKAQASKTAKVLRNQAERAQRVAKGSREVRQVAADKATQKAESYGSGRAAAAGASSSNTASTVVKKLDDENQ